MKIVPPYGSADGTPYVQGDPQTGVRGSHLAVEAITHPMEEIVHAIEQSGQTPTGANRTQLWQAIINRIAEPGIVAITGASTLVKNQGGRFIQLSGDTTYTVTLPDPTAVSGTEFEFSNGSFVDHNIATPAGTFLGPRGNRTNTHRISRGASMRIRAGAGNWHVLFQSWSQYVLTSATVMHQGMLDAFIQFTGSTLFNFALLNAANYSGSSLVIHNGGGAAHTISVASGQIKGPGITAGSSLAIPINAKAYLHAGLVDWVCDLRTS